MAEKTLEELASEPVGEIYLEKGVPFCYVAWGIKYRYKRGDWRIADIVFGDKSVTEKWMKDKYLKWEDMEGYVLPVKRCLLLTYEGDTESWTEEIS